MGRPRGGVLEPNARFAIPGFPKTILSRDGNLLTFCGNLKFMTIRRNPNMGLSELSKPYYSPEELSRILQDAGYKAELDTLQSGRKVIRSATSGYKFTLYTYGPKDDLNVVHSIQFAAYFSSKISFEQANKWNKERRFVKVYQDADGDLCLEWDVVVRYASPAFVKDCVEWWGVAISDLNEY